MCAAVLLACCQLCYAQLLGSTSSQVLALCGAAMALSISQPTVDSITLRRLCSTALEMNYGGISRA